MYLSTEVFEGTFPPNNYRDAYKELRDRQNEIDDILNFHPIKASEMLADLMIIQLTRPSAVDMIYDMALKYEAHDERLLTDYQYWTKSLSSTSHFVSLNTFSISGVHVNQSGPNDSRLLLGAPFSRRHALDGHWSV